MYGSDSLAIQNFIDDGNVRGEVTTQQNPAVPSCEYK